MAEKPTEADGEGTEREEGARDDGRESHPDEGTPPSEGNATPDDDDQDDSDDDDQDDSDDDDRTREAGQRGASKGQPGQGSGRGLLLGILGVLVGAVLGYVGHEVSQKQKLAKAKDPCGEWQSKVCAALGEDNPGCGEAKTAAHLLTPAACLAGLDDVKASVDKAKTARAVCDDLVKRLCDEVGPGTDTCKMVTDQTKAFPTAQCELMTEQFDQVLGRVRQIAAAQSRMGGAPHGMQRPDGPPGGGSSPPSGAPVIPGVNTQAPPRPGH